MELIPEEKEANRAYQEGRQGYKANHLSILDNPYPDGSRPSIMWTSGYYDAQFDPPKAS